MKSEKHHETLPTNRETNRPPAFVWCLLLLPFSRWKRSLATAILLSLVFGSLLYAQSIEADENANWTTKSKELTTLFIDDPHFEKYPQDKKDACQNLPNLITHGFLIYGVNRETGNTYSGRIQFKRAGDRFHLIVKRQIDDRIEWGVARFIYTMGGTDPGQEHALRKFVMRWKSGDQVHTVRYEHIHRLNSNPESQFVGLSEELSETLIMDSL